MLGRLIRTIPAIVLTVTDKAFVNTFLVFTLEVVGVAVHRAARGGFVGLVLAVRGAVAVPPLGYADLGGAALELLV